MSSTIQDLSELIGATLLREGVEPEIAARLVLATVLAISTGIGHRKVYVPGPEWAERALRDGMIWGQWRGDNVQELCARFDLSRAQVYRILSAQRELRREL